MFRRYPHPLLYRQPAVAAKEENKQEQPGEGIKAEAAPPDFQAAGVYPPPRLARSTLSGRNTAPSTIPWRRWKRGWSFLNSTVPIPIDERPFPTIVEVLLMGVAFELIREVGIRLPDTVGTTLGIVGALHCLADPDYSAADVVPCKGRTVTACPFKKRFTPPFFSAKKPKKPALL